MNPNPFGIPDFNALGSGQQSIAAQHGYDGAGLEKHGQRGMRAMSARHDA
jgi:hypothetical protein